MWQGCEDAAGFSFICLFWVSRRLSSSAVGYVPREPSEGRLERVRRFALTAAGGVGICVDNSFRFVLTLFFFAALTRPSP